MRITFRTIVSLAVFTAVTVGGATGAVAAEGDIHVTNQTKQPSSLAPVLQGLVEADNRTAYLRTHELAYTEVGVLVVIDQQRQTALSAPIEVTAQTPQAEGSGRVLQGYVAVDDLPAIAAAPSVRTVRPPEQGVALDDGDDTKRPGGWAGMVLALGVIVGTVVVRYVG